MNKALLALLGCLMLLFPLTIGASAQDGQAYVKLVTTKGDIILELDLAHAPITAGNFLKNVQAGYYDGLIFHRVINGFMIQGGGMDKNMLQKPAKATIKNEAGNGLKNLAYTVAMARTSDPDSASAQFFINVADNHSLDHRDNSQAGFGYAVFGKVIKGREVVEAIKAMPTTVVGSYHDVPVEPVVITKAVVTTRP